LRAPTAITIADLRRAVHLTVFGGGNSASMAVNVLTRHFRDYFIASLSCNNTNRLGGRAVPVIHDPQKKSPACLTGLCDSGNRQGDLAAPCLSAGQ
jgi:hypothetical protein